MVCSLQRKVTSLSLALKEAKAVSTGNNRRMSTSAYFIYFKVHCEKLFCGAVSSSRGLARGLWAAEREMEGWTPRLRLWPDPSVLFLEKILKRWQSSKFWPESRASQVMQCGGGGKWQQMQRLQLQMRSAQEATRPLPLTSLRSVFTTDSLLHQWSPTCSASWNDKSTSLGLTLPSY